MKIERLRISGFKSIADLCLEQVDPFLVLAGPNGSGKSNLVDALAFFGAVVARGAGQATRDFGGYPDLHCFRHRKEKSRTAVFELTLTLDKHYDYRLSIHDWDREPRLSEKLVVNQRTYYDRKKDRELTAMFWPVQESGQQKEGQELLTPTLDDQPLLSKYPHLKLTEFLKTIRFFRFDPLGAKEPDRVSTHSDWLDSHGHNVATILAQLEKTEEGRSQVVDWLEHLVPGLEKVKTVRQKLDGSTVITFQESGLRTHFPAKLVSDGTIFILCIITALLTKQSYGLTIIEEPERGIHPQAIAELVALMRSQANVDHPILITTHSESVVRSCQPQDLWLVDKEEGKTKLVHASDFKSSLGSLNLDKAWLMNFFGGGLPW